MSEPAQRPVPPIVRVALATYPPSFRERYGAEMSALLEDMDGGPHPMVGVLPARIRMRPRRMTLGYREVRFTADAPLGRAGTVARGHEFHYSTIDPVPHTVPRVWRLDGRHGGDRPEGYLIGRALMTYAHLHFASNPDVPRAFVEACADARRR